MNKKAVREAAEHWERDAVERLMAGLEPPEMGSSNCPLCKVHIEEKCDGCSKCECDHAGGICDVPFAGYCAAVYGEKAEDMLVCATDIAIHLRGIEAYGEEVLDGVPPRHDHKPGESRT